MLLYLRTNQHFVCYRWWKNMVSRHPWFFCQATQSLWWPTLPNIHTKYNSHALKGCQVSNAIWDGACQSVVTKISTPKYIHGLGWVTNSMFTTSNMHCIVLFIHLVISPSSIWLKTILSRPSPHMHWIASPFYASIPTCQPTLCLLSLMQKFGFEASMNFCQVIQI